MRLKDEKFYKTVRDFLDIYLIRHRGYSLNTQKSYREAINLLLLYFKAERGLEYSNVGFEDITYSNITGFLEWLSKSRGCSPATVNLRLMAIRSFTKYAGILDSGKIYMQVEVGNISVRKKRRRCVEFDTGLQCHGPCGGRCAVWMGESTVLYDFSVCLHPDFACPI